jgi:hypothetical protein
MCLKYNVRKNIVKSFILNYPQAVDDSDLFIYHTQGRINKNRHGNKKEKKEGKKWK